MVVCYCSLIAYGECLCLFVLLVGLVCLDLGWCVLVVICYGQLFDVFICGI